MSVGKILGIITLTITEIIIITAIIIDIKNIITYVSIQAGIFSAVWGIVGVAKWQDRKNGVK